METPYLSTLSSKGQLTLPKILREQLHLQPGAILLLEPMQGGVILKKAEVKTKDDDDYSDNEWEVLRKLASKKGKRYSNSKKFLHSLK